MNPNKARAMAGAQSCARQWRGRGQSLARRPAGGPAPSLVTRACRCEAFGMGGFGSMVALNRSARKRGVSPPAPNLPARAPAGAPIPRGAENYRRCSGAAASCCGPAAYCESVRQQQRCEVAPTPPGIGFKPSRRRAQLLAFGGHPARFSVPIGALRPRFGRVEGLDRSERSR